HLVDRTQLSAIVTMGTNDLGALGLGWYGLESFDGRPSRWSCGYGIAFLGAPESSGRVTLSISCSSLRPPDCCVRRARAARGRAGGHEHRRRWVLLESCYRQLLADRGQP